MIVSGVVALTLSPMMGSKLLRAGDTERGFAGMINRHFDAVRAVYMRRCSRNAQVPAGGATSLWGVVALLIVPFYMFSQKELAPNEDQGVVFGIVQAAPNSTLDQTKLFTNEVYDVYQSFPETEDHLPDHLPDRRLRRHGDQAVERARRRRRSSSRSQSAGSCRRSPACA